MSPRLVMLVLVAGAIGVGLVVQGPLSSALADKPETGVRAEVREAMEAYTQAVSRKDIDACMAAFAPGPDTVLMGTGPGERWQGPEEIREAHMNFFNDFDKETSESTWKLVRMSGDTAWGAAMVHSTNYFKNKKNEFFLNISAVLQKQEGQWRIVLFHFSNLTGPDLTG